MNGNLSSATGKNIFAGVCKTIKLKLLLQFENNCQIMQIPSDCLEYFSPGPPIPPS